MSITFWREFKNIVLQKHNVSQTHTVQNIQEFWRGWFSTKRGTILDIFSTVLDPSWPNLAQKHISVQVTTSVQWLLKCIKNMKSLLMTTNELFPVWWTINHSIIEEIPILDFLLSSWGIWPRQHTFVWSFLVQLFLFRSSWQTFFHFPQYFSVLLWSTSFLSFSWCPR